MIKFFAANHMKIKCFWLPLVTLVTIGVPLMSVAGENSAPSRSIERGDCAVVPGAPCADEVHLPSLIERRAGKPLPGHLIIDKSDAPAAKDVQPNSQLSIGQPPVLTAAKVVTTSMKLSNSTGYRIYWRVGAVRNGQLKAWPSFSSYWTVSPRSSVTKSISCNKGETIYFGATSSNGSYYWGLGVNGDQYCNWATCESICDGKMHTLSLTY